jgi:hypothetical protein
MAIKHPVLIALSTLSIICVSTASVSALYSPRPAVLALTKERPQSGVGWSITTTSGEAELANIPPQLGFRIILPMVF